MRPTTKLRLDLIWTAYERALAEYRKQVAVGTTETIRYARETVEARRRDLQQAQLEVYGET